MRQENSSLVSFIITKAGGVTTTEAINLGVPMITYKTSQGQENRNTQYLVKTKTALHVDSETQAVEALKDLLEHPEKLGHLRNSAKRIRVTDSLKKITQNISADFSRKNSPSHR